MPLIRWGGRYGRGSIVSHWVLSSQFLFVCLKDRVSLGNPGCPGTCSADQVILELKRSACLCFLSAVIKCVATTSWLPSRCCFRQTNGKHKARVQCTFFFPFLLTLNTSINQQLHSVTTIVMLEGEGKKGKRFLRKKKGKKKKKDDSSPQKLIKRKKDNRRAGREQQEPSSPTELK